MRKLVVHRPEPRHRQRVLPEEGVKVEKVGVPAGQVPFCSDSEALVQERQMTPRVPMG